MTPLPITATDGRIRPAHIAHQRLDMVRDHTRATEWLMSCWCALRRIGLHDTDFAQATCGTIRLKLLKIGALVRISVRRIKFAMASACPAARDWGRAAVRLAIAALARASPA